MKVIIAGSRSFNDYGLLSEVMYQLFEDRGPGTNGYDDLIILSGMAKGADLLGVRWAQDHRVPVYKYPADWDRHGPAAGPIRNREMAAAATCRGGSESALIAFWDGQSRGTKNMIHEAINAGVGEVHVYQFEE